MAATGVEKQYYDQLFALVDSDDAGVLPGHDALPFLTSSGLPPQTLGEIWAIADPENNGFITKEGWYKAARVIGWVQKGNKTQVDGSLASKPGPLPTFKGYPSPPTLQQGPLSANVTGTGLPPLTASDRTNFTRIFVGCGPSNGFVSGDKARDVFLKSKLNYDKLGLIWNLADTQQRGALDLTDFIIGMYLIQSCMANPALNLPTTLPPGTYEAASGGRSAPTSPPPRGPGSPIQRQMTGTLQPQLTGQSLVAAAATPPRSMTASSMAASSLPAPFGSDASPPWDVTPDAKAASDRFFAQLDTQNKGVIEGDVAVPFMLQSNLDEGTLASVWDLADIRQEGKLDRDEFAVAMHLINSKLAGKDIPATLPISMIPPRLRSQAAAPPAPAKDLFDLFDDEAAPPASAPSLATAFLPQPPTRRGTADTPTRQVQPFGSVPTQPTPQASGDLLGEDSNETPSASLDKSADLGNKQNQLANTNRSITELGKTRGELEQNAASTATQLATLEAELSTARMKHETETKTVADLRIRVGEQTAKLKQLQAEVISAESDLTAMRMEKQELEQALLNGKEEVRELQKRMKEFEDEKTGLKLLLDKIKKEARQQKGMVAIAKKQVSTAESARDTAQQEVRDAEAEADAPEVTVPSPVRALSPEATGNSRSSTNPFDRLNRSASATSDPSSNAPAFAAFAGGATAAGAIAGGLVANADDKRHSLEQAPETEAVVPDQTDVDPFGAPTPTATSALNDDDPFGAGQIGQSGVVKDGFGDSFNSTAAGAPQVTDGPSDFDAAFADSDDSREEPIPPVDAYVSPPKFAFNSDVRPEAERSDSTRAVPPSSIPHTPLESPDVAQDGESSDEDEGPEDLNGPRRAYSRSASPPAENEPVSIDHAIAAPLNASSSAATTGAANTPSPLSDDAHKTRRSAPPPPTSRSHSQATPSVPPTASLATTGAEHDLSGAEHDLSGAEHDPFGAPAPAGGQQASATAVAPAAPATNVPSSVELDPFGAPVSPTAAAKQPTPVNPFGAPFAPIAPFATSASSPFPVPPATSTLSSVPKTSQFDDENFDFPDLPKAQESAPSANPVGTSTAFDDEFANFDDDFDKPASQVQTSSDKSYEVVSAPQAQDEWGMPKAAASGPSNSLSFDDAFGGDFSPGAAETTFGNANAPPLPERPDLPQPDDLEDVKKLCGMGFPRSLVVEALDANGYSFQKALNVLLDK